MVHGLAGRLQGVAAAVLVVAAAEDLVRAVEKDDLVGDVVVVQLDQRVGEVVKEPLAAQVAGHGQVAVDAGVDAHDVGQLQHEPGREVVDAKEAHVLKGVQCLGAPAAGHARDDHDVGHAVGRGGAAHVFVCHGCPPASVFVESSLS